MSSENATDEEEAPSTAEESPASGDVRERLDAGRERAVEGFDEGVVDVLSWVLDTETRAKIYVHLRRHPDSTSDEVAEGTGLYPSTVREALAELHDEATVERDKRESGGAGNNPYEYRAIPPSALVRGAIEDVQDSLNAVFQLDRYLGGEETSDEEPVTITVEEGGQGVDLETSSGDLREDDGVDRSNATVGDDLVDSEEEDATSGDDDADDGDAADDASGSQDGDIDESL